MITPIRGFGLLLLALIMTGCAQTSCRQGPYLEARAVPPMQVPEDLDAPDRQMALRVPDQRSVPGRPGTEPDGCIAKPPPFYAEAGAPNPEGLPARPATAADIGPLPASRRVTRQVTRFVESWAKAWDSRDFEAWAGFYAADFVPEGYESHAAWRTEQQRLFEVPATTRIERGSIRVNMLQDGRARTRFTQEFDLRGEGRTVVKELVLTRSPGRRGWRIVEDYIVELR